MHLVEIDLLRGGTHTTAVDRDRVVRKAGLFDYHVSVHHFDRWEEYVVYPIRLHQRLPRIKIPLLPGDGEVLVDLQEAFNTCYEVGAYERRVSYGEMKLVPPLPPDQLDWLVRLLREKGLLVAS